eukprot:SAG31_NODE_1615_length_7737_cov_5.540848_2_plen_681_part_00
MTAYVPLTSSTLHEWCEDEESAAASESLTDFRSYSLEIDAAVDRNSRSWALGLVVALAETCPEAVLPVVVEGLQALPEPCDPGAVLQLDSWLCVGGLCSTALLHAGFDLSGWVGAVLGSAGSYPTIELEGVSCAAILGRRAAWLVGIVANGTKKNGSLLPSVADDQSGIGLICTQALVHWLDGPDMATRLTATMAIKGSCDRSEAMQAALASDGGGLANAAVMRLLAVSSAADGPTNKWEAINTVMTLLEKIGAAAGAVEEASLHHIMQTWNSSGSTEDAALLQCALLDLVTQLCSVSTELATAVESVAVHMVTCCMENIDALPLEVNEMVCKLWTALMRAQLEGSAMRPALESLFPSLSRLLSSDAVSDCLRAAMPIVNEYLMIGGEMILASEEARAALFSGFASILGAELRSGTRTEGMQHTARTFELAVQMLQPDEIATWAPTVAPAVDLVALGILHSGGVQDIVRAAYVCTWARLVVVAGGSAAVELFAMLEVDRSRAAAYAHAATGNPAATAEHLAGLGGLLGCLLDKATELFDCQVTRPRRKLCAVAMCQALAATGGVGPEIAATGVLLHGRLTAIFGCCIELIIEDAERISRGMPTVACQSAAAPLNITASSGASLRWRDFTARDNESVTSVDMASYLREALAAAAGCGDAFHRAMAEVDPAVAGQIRQLGIV